MPVGERIPFIVVGENIHASRTYARSGRNVVVVDDEVRVAFVDDTGALRTCPIATPVRLTADFATKVKHIRSALLLGMGGDHALPFDRTGPVSPEASQDGRDYLISAALRQQWSGAHYVDVNVDEVDPDEGVRARAMEWMVALLEPRLAVPLALDSSSIAVMEAGLRASTASAGPVLLNSASLERPNVLELAARARAAIVLSAAGRSSLPTDSAERIANATEIYAAALDHGISADLIHVDLLVLPVGVDPEAGDAFLEAVRQFRVEHGSAVRVTGGLSNVSFGLPNRKLLNEVFVALAVDSGVDSGILDPVAVDIERARRLDIGAKPYRVAANVLTGADAFAVDYLAAHRAGELAADDKA